MSDMSDQPQRAGDRDEREQTQPPVMVGVTGHRPSGLAGADHDTLSERATAALAAVARSAAPRPLTIVSPLAEGADRLVARAALDAGHELRCVLPFPRDDYLRDFSTVASRADYRALLSLAASVTELHGARETPESADAAYSDVGDWITAHSDVLIAIWDGGKARGKGGAGDVVQSALGRGLPVIWIASQPPHAVKLLDQHDGFVAEHDDLSAWKAPRLRSR